MNKIDAYEAIVSQVARYNNPRDWTVTYGRN